MVYKNIKILLVLMLCLLCIGSVFAFESDELNHQITTTGSGAVDKSLKDVKDTSGAHEIRNPKSDTYPNLIICVDSSCEGSNKFILPVKNGNLQQDQIYYCEGNYNIDTSSSSLVWTCDSDWRRAGCIFNNQRYCDIVDGVSPISDSMRKIKQVLSGKIVEEDYAYFSKVEYNTERKFNEIQYCHGDAKIDSSDDSFSAECEGSYDNFKDRGCFFNGNLISDCIEGIVDDNPPENPPTDNPYDGKVLKSCINDVCEGTDGLFFPVVNTKLTENNFNPEIFYCEGYYKIDTSDDKFEGKCYDVGDSSVEAQWVSVGKIYKGVDVTDGFSLKLKACNNGEGECSGKNSFLFPVTSTATKKNDQIYYCLGDYAIDTTDNNFKGLCDGNFDGTKINNAWIPAGCWFNGKKQKDCKDSLTDPPSGGSTTLTQAEIDALEIDACINNYCVGSNKTLYPVVNTNTSQFNDQMFYCSGTYHINTSGNSFVSHCDSVDGWVVVGKKYKNIDDVTSGFSVDRKKCVDGQGQCQGDNSFLYPVMNSNTGEFNPQVYYCAGNYEINTRDGFNGECEDYNGNSGAWIATGCWFGGVNVCNIDVQRPEFTRPNIPSSDLASCMDDMCLGINDVIYPIINFKTQEQYDMKYCPGFYVIKNGEDGTEFNCFEFFGFETDSYHNLGDSYNPNNALISQKSLWESFLSSLGLGDEKLDESYGDIYVFVNSENSPVGSKIDFDDNNCQSYKDGVCVDVEFGIDNIHIYDQYLQNQNSYKSLDENKIMWTHRSPNFDESGGAYEPTENQGLYYCPGEYYYIQKGGSKSGSYCNNVDGKEIDFVKIGCNYDGKSWCGDLTQLKKQIDLCQTSSWYNRWLRC